MKRTKLLYSGDNWSLTLRELIASISIVAMFLVFGLIIYQKIDRNISDKNDIYRKAIGVTDESRMKYGIDTEIGYAFCSGELTSHTQITHPDIDGTYMSIEIQKQKYRTHYRRVNGKTHIYHSWDTIDTDYLNTDYVKWLGFDFSFKQISGLNYERVKMVETGYHMRNIYYGIPDKIDVSSFIKLTHDTVNQTIVMHRNVSVNELREMCLNGGILTKVLFWIGWIILTGLVVFVFYYADNNWLED